MKRIGKRAMTNAERQARYRKNLREAKAAALAAEKAQEAARSPRRAYQPPHGYGKAKQTLIDAGHQFERARREWGFEEGVFVDGAYLGGFGQGAAEVLDLAEMTPDERQQFLAERRADECAKGMACSAVSAFMAGMRITVADLLAEAERRQEQRQRQQEYALASSQKYHPDKEAGDAVVMRSLIKAKETLLEQLE